MARTTVAVVRPCGYLFPSIDRLAVRRTCIRLSCWRVTNGIDDVHGELNANAVLTSGVSTGDGESRRTMAPDFRLPLYWPPFFIRYRVLLAIWTLFDLFGEGRLSFR